MGFEQRLTQLIAHAEPAGEHKLDASLRAVVACIVSALKDDWTQFDKQDLNEDAEDAGEAAIWLDAVTHAKSSLIHPKTKFHDIRLNEGLTPGDVAAEVSSCVGKSKGWLYVLWDDDGGDDFEFVGTATTIKQMKFTGKSGLAKALPESDTLSIVIPPKVTRSDLEEAASSIIHLIRCVADCDPTYNEDVDAEMPDSPAWDRVQQLSDLLEHAGVHLFNRAKTGED